VAMDLRSTLKPGDLFVSYWFDQRLTVMAGDVGGILSTETVPVDGLPDLLAAFERQVSRPDVCPRFFAENRHPAHWRSTAQSGPSLIDLLTAIASRIVTPALGNEIERRRHHRLLLFPDGLLHVLPIHLVLDAGADGKGPAKFGEGVLYAPSASAYVYACSKRFKGSPRKAAVVVGDRADGELIREAEGVARRMPCPVEVVTRWSELEKVAPEADILYVATHGSTEGPANAGHEPPDRAVWHLSFDCGSLGPADLYQERIRLRRGAVVVLSACSVGRLTAGPVHELQGLVQALFYAGAATVLAARWPIVYEAAEAVFGGCIERVCGGGTSLGAALADAIRSARAEPALASLASGPEAAPFFWGPFALFGCGD
jgi:hypothetical protein